MNRLITRIVPCLLSIITASSPALADTDGCFSASSALRQQRWSAAIRTVRTQLARPACTDVVTELTYTLAYASEQLADEHPEMTCEAARLYAIAERDAEPGIMARTAAHRRVGAERACRCVPVVTAAQRGDGPTVRAALAREADLGQCLSPRVRARWSTADAEAGAHPEAATEEPSAVAGAVVGLGGAAPTVADDAPTSPVEASAPALRGAVDVEPARTVESAAAHGRRVAAAVPASAPTYRSAEPVSAAAIGLAAEVEPLPGSSLGWGLTAGSAATLAGGLALFHGAQIAQAQLDAAVEVDMGTDADQERINDARWRRDMLDRAGWAAVAVGAGLAVGAIVVFATDDDDRVSGSIGPTGGSVSVRF